MTLITDSASVADYAEPATQWPFTDYPPLTDQELGGFFDHLVNVSRGDLVSALPGLSEPGLYTLAAALGRGSRGEALTEGLTDALVAELRWRNCRAMGTDPAGPVRRGRLLQMVRAFTELKALGASSLQRQKLAGRCHFCQSESLQVFLPSVRWRCFGCERGGGLLEFAEELLTVRA
ncbi:MAG: hypothetical protein F4W95_07825 [Chloroflexi bacterium]|nr:hypothetical protein [Chloroflexota bacterium]MYD48379.1 hypothetical protein [Chloroflexota bacterium]